MQSGLSCSGFPDEVGQVGDSICEADAIEQVVPEGDVLFLTGLFQAGEGIPTSPAFIGAGAAADLSFDDVFADIAFT